MNRSQLEGSAEAVKWSMCLDRILHCNGSLLFGSFGFAKQESSHCDRFLVSQVRHKNDGDPSCHAAFHRYVAIRLLNGPSVTFNHLKNHISHETN